MYWVWDFLLWILKFDNEICYGGFRYYLMYGYVVKMVEEIKKGVLMVDGVEVSLF